MTNTIFENNIADKSGGAVFLDGLDSYLIEIKDITFEDNQARIYGDNLYIS